MRRPSVSLALSRRHRPDELLLVERSRRLRYFGGFLAFPGGTLDEEDGDIPVTGVSEDGLAPYVAAGARELFEETGIWLARGGRTPEPRLLKEDRRRLLAGEVSFGALLERNGQHVAADDLEPLCEITTPPFAPVRYETRFLRGLVPEDASVEIWDGELVGGSFVDPKGALRRWRNGEIQIAPPMILLLDEWSKGQEGLGARIRKITESYEAGRLHRIYFSPGVLLAPLRTPTQPPATHTNTCVVGEERLFVVDPSPVDGEERERFWNLLDELVGEGRRIEGILLTHYHPDHIGALSETAERYGVPSFAHADCIPHLPAVPIGRALEHGDELPLGRAPDGSAGWKLVSFHVPGHAKGHLAFQDSRYGAILVGDLVSTLSSILIDPRDGHLATYLDSLRFLRSVTRGTLYPGHGPPTADGPEVLRKALEHRREREEQLVAALDARPQTPQALVKKIYTDVAPEMHGLAERSLLSGLRKLEEEGRVRRAGNSYRLA